MAAPIKSRRAAIVAAFAGTAVLLLSQCTTSDAGEPSEWPPSAEPSTTEEKPAPPETCPEDHDGPYKPDGEADPIFVAESGAYYTNSDAELASGPYLAVYADGTVATTPGIDDGAETPVEDQDPLTPIDGGWIDPCTFDWLTGEFAAMADTDYGSMHSVEDGGYSKFLVDAGGGELTEVHVDQFGLESDDGADPDLSSEEYQAREDLHELLDVISSKIMDAEPLPDRVRLVAQEHGDGYSGVEFADWTGLGDLQLCEVIESEDEVNQLRERFRDADVDLYGPDSGAISDTGAWEYFTDPDDQAAGTATVAALQIMPGLGECDELDDDLF